MNQRQKVLITAKKHTHKKALSIYIVLELRTESNVSGVRAWTLSATTLVVRDSKMATPLRRRLFPWTIVMK
jgi:hypothetical protein